MKNRSLFLEKWYNKRSPSHPQQAIANAQEAIASYLDYCEEEGLVPPSLMTVAA